MIDEKEEYYEKLSCIRANPNNPQHVATWYNISIEDAIQRLQDQNSAKNSAYHCSKIELELYTDVMREFLMLLGYFGKIFSIAFNDISSKAKLVEDNKKLL